MQLALRLRRQFFVYAFNVFILLNGWICYFAWCVRPRRLLYIVGFRTHLKSMHTHLIHLISGQVSIQKSEAALQLVNECY